MHMYLSVLTLFLLLLSQALLADITKVPNLDNRVYELSGDIMIGGLFPLHQAGEGMHFCGPLRELGVLQRAEAMAYYIKQINAKKLIPGVKLGYRILDDCYKETTALAQALKFVAKRGEGADDVVAVIGAESSSNSKQVAELLGLFQIPQVSYFSTSEKLSDTVAYPYFTRIVPSDVHQIKAVISLLNHYNWTYVSFIGRSSVYGFNALLDFLRQLSDNFPNICLATQELLPHANNTEFHDVLHKLQTNTPRNTAHAVIVFLPQPDAAKLLEEAQNSNLSGRFIWIASDAWARNVQDLSGLEDIAEGLLGFKINSTNDKEFDDFFSNMDPLTSDNPFMEEFWEASCNLSRIRCEDHYRFKDLAVYKPETTISLVKIAVYLLANQIKELLKTCVYANRENLELCKGEHAREFINGTTLQTYLRNIEGCIGTTCIEIGPDGDGSSQYSIMNLHNSGNTYKLIPVGYFDNNNLDIKERMIHWNPKIQKKRKDGVPKSICSEPCRPGEQQHRSISNAKCCWHCETCKNNEITYNYIEGSLSTVQCKQCEDIYHNASGLTLYSKPVNQSTACEIVVPQSLSISDSFALSILIIDIVLLLMTVVLLALYIKNHEHKLIKATSRELSAIIWFGVIFSYAMVAWFFIPLNKGCEEGHQCNPRPRFGNCYVEFIAFNLAFSVIYAPILMRVNRIYRIFTQAKKSAKKPKLIENRYQIGFAGVMIAIQVLIIMATSLISRFAFDKPLIRVENYKASIASSYLYCNIEYTALIPSVTYNFLLTIACAAHAFKVRKLPDNFNESRFIGLTVYTTIIMWIAFVPAYITSSTRYYKSLPLAGALMLNALITTTCLFIPKLYALRWVGTGKLNVRSQSMSTTSVCESRRASLAVDSINQLPIKNAVIATNSVKFISITEDNHEAMSSDSGYTGMASDDVNTDSTYCNSNSYSSRDGMVESTT